ncbi:hypothetical protein C4J81_02210 [Deltaproteobacteria bacterium Smac51]|nr:hypothetical protein C4J81_02210 [Deltaproteobacteria bacterium Smac51]
MTNENKKTLRRLALGLSPALLWVFCSTGYLQAQENQEPVVPAAEEKAETADHTITLTKVVEVYEFEDLKVSVDQYQVNRGDSLVKILKSRGIVASSGDEARMMRLVRSLNPELTDLNKIQPGQVLNLPAELKDETIDAEETAAASEPAPELVDPATVTRMVKVYERTQPEQQPAKVVVMRHTPGEGTVETATPAPTLSMGEEQTGGSPQPVQAGGPAGNGLNFPSGNHGPLAVEPDSGVVYRTVKIRRGDTLERLLRREGMDNDLIYAHLLKVTLKLNPEIKSQDMIFAGAELRIPAAGDYLAGLAGVNPEAVKAAALARSEGRRPEAADDGRAGALKLPSATVETGKTTLGLIFTRLGAGVDTRGRLVLPVGSDSIEFNTTEFPVIELPDDRRVVIDLESRLPRQTVNQLREKFPNYQVFRTKRGERLEKALDKLWPLCGYFRVYKKDRTYEGGTDIKLKIAADWMIWPTRQAWNSGQPLVINLASGADRKTAPAWKTFLSGHGIGVMDLFQGTVIPDEPQAASEELKITRLSENNPSLAAAELVRLLGGEPKVGVQLDRVPSAGEGQPELTAPVLWEHGSRQVVVEFGELSAEAVKTMREAGYRVVSAQAGQENVIKAVIEGFGLAPKEALVLNAPAGGPVMSLSIKGLLVSADNERDIFFTGLDMPSGIAGLVPAGLEIIRY